MRPPLLRSAAFLALVGTALPAVVAEDADPFGPARRPPAGSGPRRDHGGPPPEDDARPADVAAYRPWLAREDWLCRALAARELRLRSDDGVVGALARTLDAERDPRVLALLLAALDGRPRDDLLAEGGVALAERLVALLEVPRASVRSRALRVLATMPPVRLPAEADALRAWWAKGRAGLEVEAGLVLERVRAVRAAAPRPHGLAPGETHTVAPLAVRRYADLDRIAREGLEVVVCLDATGSMVGVIDAAKASVADLTERLRELAPRFRVGLVTYHDDARVRLALTADASAFARELKKVVADGGGDAEEGVDRAVLLALRQDRVAWSRKALRVVVVVGDAPPHEEDVAPLLRALRDAREDPLYEAPVRVDTISTGGDGPDGLVPHFAAIASAGGGAATRLRGTASLATELLVASFGPAWRDAIRELLADLDGLRAEDERSGRRR